MRLLIIQATRISLIQEFSLITTFIPTKSKFKEKYKQERPADRINARMQAMRSSLNNIKVTRDSSQLVVEQIKR